MQKMFNTIIAGVGGQGLITLLQIIAKAAMNKGYDVKTSELHGLSQRGGSVSVHIRFDKKVYSPIVPKGKANLILALELQEALNVSEFASKNSVFLVNQYQTPTLGKTISESQVKKELEKVSRKNTFLPATNTCKKELGTDVTAGVFLLGYAVKEGLIPFEDKDIRLAIKEVMPEKYWELNLKTLDIAEKYASKT